ncbi:MAG: PTS sugar transporter subunit IIA [Proteobacteria bacterium]|nr:PTS sugar transporter subunit IIA [Pseudomonadota bacterium]
MKILDILDEESIITELKSKSKKEAIEEMAVVAAKNDDSVNIETLVEVLIEREKLGSTGIGDGVAIPHGKLSSIENVMAVFARSEEGIDFDSMDGKNAHLFFLLIAPEDSAGSHLKALARVSRLMNDPKFRLSLMEAKSREEVYRTFADEDAKY